MLENIVNVKALHKVYLDEDTTEPRTCFVCRTLTEGQMFRIRQLETERMSYAEITTAHTRKIEEKRKALREKQGLAEDQNPAVTDAEDFEIFKILQEKCFVNIQMARSVNRKIFSLVVVDMDHSPFEVTKAKEEFGQGVGAPEWMSSQQILEVINRGVSFSQLTETDSKNLPEQSGSGKQSPDLTAADV